MNNLENDDKNQKKNESATAPEADPVQPPNDKPKPLQIGRGLGIGKAGVL